MKHFEDYNIIITDTWYLYYNNLTSFFSLRYKRIMNKRPMGLDALLKNQLGHHQVQGSKSCTYTLFPAQGGVKFRLFLLYGERFPRYGPIFKIAIFGHETWQVAKVPEVAHMLSFYPKGLKLSLFLLYGQRFPRYGPIF